MFHGRNAEQLRRILPQSLGADALFPEQCIHHLLERDIREALVALPAFAWRAAISRSKARFSSAPVQRAP